MKRESAIRLDHTAEILLTLGLLVLVMFGGYLLVPRTTNLSGDWTAPAVDGDVVAGRALVSDGNAALDLRTGKSVRLGSVVGGTATYADDRLIVVKGERVDSVRLDASARWTWRAPAGHTAIPLAAAGGSTLIADCPTPTRATCRLVGLDSAGDQAWESTDAERPTDESSASVPRILAQPVEGGGVRLTDPVSGRSTLQPGSSITAVPDGPVVVAGQQGGQCVVSAFTSPDPLWTRVLGPCPGGELPQVSVTAEAALLSSPGRVQRFALATGATQPPPSAGPVPRVVADAGSLVATRRVDPPPAKAILPWWDAQVLELRDARSGDVRARLVTERPVALLVLEPGAVVVREGGMVTRYTLDN